VVALDPRIPLMGQAAPIQNPLETITAIAELQDVRERTEARRLAGEEARTKHLRQQQIGAAYRDAIKVDDKGEVTVDYALLTNHLPPDLIPGVIKELQADKASALTLQKTRMELAKLGQEHLGSAARTIIAAKGDQHIWDLELDVAHKNGALTDDGYQRLLQIQDPEQRVAIANSFLERAVGPPKLEKIETTGPGGEAVTQFVTPTAGATYPVAPPKPTPLSYQAKDVLVDGRPALASFNPQTGTYTINGQDVTARVRPIPPQGPQPSYQWAVPPGATKPVLMTPQEIRASGATSTGAPGEAGAVKLSPAQQEDLATMLTVQDLGKNALELGDQIKWRGVGPIAGRTGAFEARWLGTGGEDPERLRNLLGNIQGTIAKLRGGASFTPNEQAMLDRYTPTTTDSVLQIKTKLKSLSDFITAKRENTLRVAGGQYTPRETPSTTGPRAGERPSPPPTSGATDPDYQAYLKSKAKR
jgi:hypothetical protein